MTPETPDPPPVSQDPWDSVHEEFAGMSQWETARVYRADPVDAARAADALRHQQELRQGDAEIEACRREIARLTQEPFRLTQELTAARAALSTAEATIQQQAKELLGERDAFKADVCAFSREQVQEAVNATLAAETERDAAQQEIAALRRALGDAFADRVVAALSSSPHPQEPQPRVPGCDDRLGPLQPMDAVVAIARPQEQEPQPLEPTKPRKPVVNLMEALQKSLDSLKATRT